MPETIQRITPYDLELRGSDGRTVHGIAVPYGEDVPIREGRDEYVERFRYGAFARSIEQAGHKVKLLAVHDKRRFPLGRATQLREDTAGLLIEARISKTRDGDEAIELIRDGALDSFSVGFQPIRDNEQRTADGRRLIERLEARLREVSLVPFGAYPGAVIQGVRTAVPVTEPTLSPAEARRRLAALSTIARTQ